MHSAKLFYFAILPLKVLFAVDLFIIVADQGIKVCTFKFPTYHQFTAASGQARVSMHYKHNQVSAAHYGVCKMATLNRAEDRLASLALLAWPRMFKQGANWLLLTCM